MKLVDVTKNVAYHVSDLGDHKAMMIIVEHPSGELNIYDFSKERMSVYGESSYHDFLEPMYDDPEDTTLEETDWCEVELLRLNALSEITLVHELIKEFVES